jgi:hypothetical protein
VSDHSTSTGTDGHDSAGSHAVEREKPSDWGWNAEFGPWASRAGWIVVFFMGTLFIGITHYNRAGFLAQALVIVGLVTVLLWDRNRKRTSWRD